MYFDHICPTHPHISPQIRLHPLYLPLFLLCLYNLLSLIGAAQIFLGLVAIHQSMIDKPEATPLKTTESPRPITEDDSWTSSSM